MRRIIDKLIVLDIDGTCLVREPHEKIDSALIDYFKALDHKGIKWAINSDRYLQDILHLIQPVSDSIKPVAVLSQQRFIHMKNEVGGYESVPEWNNRMLNYHQILWQKIAPHFDDWLEQLTQQFSISEILINKEVCSFRVSLAIVNDFQKALGEVIRPWPEAKISGNHDWIYIVHRFFSKGLVLEQLANIFKLDKRDIVAVGDGFNDISMLNGTITPFVGCPSNAFPEVKNAVVVAGGYIAKEKEASGTYQVIQHYINPAIK